MALDITSLTYELLKILDPNDPEFVGYPATKADVALNWGNAYDIYAKNAMDVSGDVLLSSHPTAFVSTLEALLPDGAIGTAIDAADAFDKAFIAYWTGAIFSIGIPPIPTGIPPVAGIGGTGLFSIELSSVVVSVTPNILYAGLLVVCGVLSNNPVAKSLSIAGAFHVATKFAVNVLISGLDTTPPPVGPLPITNTGLIF